MNAELTFHGAAECVTGSCMLLETEGRRILVDCGMFQGPKTLKALNYEPFPFSPASLDAVLLTHAHIDHAGGTGEKAPALHLGQFVEDTHGRFLSAHKVS